MSALPITGLPGVQTDRTATPRRILRSTQNFARMPGGALINATLSGDGENTGDTDILQAGVLLGRITATGLYRPAVIGALTVHHTGDSITSMTVSAATATELNRLGTSGVFTLTGPPTAGGTMAAAEITYSAVDTGTGVITITAETTDFRIGSLLGGWHATASDGSQVPVTILANERGTKVTDQDAVRTNVEESEVLIGGHLDSSQIVHWPSDVSIQKYIMAMLNSTGSAAVTAQPVQGAFIFDHLQN